MAERRRDRLAQVAKRRQEIELARQAEREQRDEFERSKQIVGEKPRNPERGQVQ
jgi:hypothetical protein